MLSKRNIIGSIARNVMF